MLKPLWMLLTHPPLVMLLSHLSWKTADLCLIGFLKEDLGKSTGRLTSALIFLASLGLLLDSEFVVFSSPPVDLTNLFEVDAVGLFVSRLCSAPLFAV